MKREYQYKSVLAPYFKGYIRLKEAAGQKVDAYHYMFLQFDKFLIETGHDEPIITKNLIERWRQTRVNDAPMTIGHKYSAWAGVARYMQSLGIKSYIASNPAKMTCRLGFAPYIFKKSQIEKMFKESVLLSHAGAVKNNSGLNAFPPLIRTIYSTGLRLGEAIRITISDVQFDNKAIIIRHSKNGHERIVPICDSLEKVLSDYARIRERIIRASGESNQDAFFLRNDGKPLSYGLVYHWFQELLDRCGIPYLGDGFGPRVHDLRHTFAVHAIKQMVDNGTEIFTALSILAAVLGHKNISSTEYYIRLTEAEFPEISQRSSSLMSEVYPKLNDYENKPIP